MSQPQIYAKVGTSTPDGGISLESETAVPGTELRPFDIVKEGKEFYRVYEDGHEGRLRFWCVTSKVPPFTYHISEWSKKRRLPLYQGENVSRDELLERVVITEKQLTDLEGQATKNGRSFLNALDDVDVFVYRVGVGS